MALVTTVLILVLALPLVAAAGAVLVSRHQQLFVQSAAAAAAVGWTVLVASTDPPTLGRLVAEPLGAAAAAGYSLLVAARPPRTPLSRSAALTGITLFGATAAVGEGSVPDRPLAVGVALLGVLALLRSMTEGRGIPGSVPVAAGVAAVVTGLLVDDAERAAVLVIVGAVLVLVVAVVSDPSAVLLVPAALLATVRMADAAHAGRDASGLDAVGAVGAGAGVVLAAALFAARRPWNERLALAALAAAPVLLAQDVVEVRRAGLLVAAGGVLAIIGRHPVAPLALVPGLAATVGAFGLASEPMQAAGGAAVVLVAAATTADRGSPRGDPARPGPARPDPTRPVRAGQGRSLFVVPAVAFGVLPLWGWTGAAVDGYVEAVVTAAAVALPVLVVVVAWPELAAVRSTMTRGTERSTGRIPFRRGRSAATPDGSTHEDVEDEGTRGIGVEEGAGTSPSS